MFSISLILGHFLTINTDVLESPRIIDESNIETIETINCTEPTNGNHRDENKYENRIPRQSLKQGASFIVQRSPADLHDEELEKFRSKYHFDDVAEDFDMVSD